MLPIVSIEGDECSISTRAKSIPADFISWRMAGLRTMLTHDPICASPRARPSFIGLVRIFRPCVCSVSWIIQVVPGVPNPCSEPAPRPEGHFVRQIYFSALA